MSLETIGQTLIEASRLMDEAGVPREGRMVFDESGVHPIEYDDEGQLSFDADWAKALRNKYGISEPVQ